MPAVLAVAVLGGVAVAGLASSSCTKDKPVVDAASDGIASDGNMECSLFCIPDGTDAGTVCSSCADAGNCPSGCRPVG